MMYRKGRTSRAERHLWFHMLAFVGLLAIIGPDALAAVGAQASTHRRALSPQSPMYLIHVTYSTGDTPEEIIGAVPEDVLPYVVLNLNPAGTKVGTNEGYLLMREWLQVAKDKGVWAMVQPSAGIINRMDDADTTNYERLYADFSNMIGFNWSEQTWGFNSNTFSQRLNLLSDLIELSHRYGGYVYINDAMSISNSSWNTIAKFKTHQRFRDTARKHSERVIFGNKTTHGWGYYDNESMALGAFLGGYADHYAIRYDQHAWTWSGKTKLFGFEGTRAEAEARGAMSLFTNPEALMGAHIAEHLMLSGATVIDGPEVEWISAVFDGAPTPNFNNVMIDLLRKVIDGTIVIPTRQTVARRTKVALVSDGSSNNTPASLFTGVYKMDSDGEHKENRRWLKMTGRYPTIPYLYGGPADAKAYELVINQSGYGSVWPSQNAKVRQLNSLFPAESTGDMFVGRVANAWLAYNPNINTDRNTSGEFGLRFNSCSSVAINYTPHTFSVIKEGDRSLSIYLNNYRADKTPLWDAYPDGLSMWRLKNYVLPEFLNNPIDSALRKSTFVLKGCSREPYITVTERGSHKPSNITSRYQYGELTVTAMHNGPIDIFVGNAIGNNTDRPPVPSDPPVMEPERPAHGVWLDAECGKVGSFWRTPQSSTAALGRYVTVVGGNKSIESPPSTEGWVSLDFNLSSSAEYGIWGRVRAPSPNEDSFWVKVNSQSWLNWNNLSTTNEWTWKKVGTRSLNAGSNTITIGYREDGAHLDKLYVGTGTPSGYGESSSNRCN